ncbi:cobyrinic acid a,c-diamide synthase [Solemya pervernicosa gill symbiont]|uniref:Cobyrinic acid a,c-diamide synthase n=2 Tax=Gammaproteobacteria incertae sedis TaxID=118884 RepID=A0A1T2L1H2_9GAMM|nr:AAA family ATPase [Candidatus Reidiella endopervernicosa]OOZ38939.1 cobyrinic acid a,c-diamide synthase [Solemya pervernicosa gill symbiont]QKQ26827.1 AAA family ATPase [Candidatus Reidiella endopervernicosa]
MKTIACYNIKGGVGKTATAINLSYLSALEGHSTLVWDLDPQGAASFYFRIKAKIKGGTTELFKRRSRLQRAIKATDYEGLDLIPADFSYRNLDLLLEQKKHSGQQLGKLLKPIHSEYDYLFLDCPPSISLVSENVFEMADLILVPTIPSTLSLRTLSQLQKFCSNNGYNKGKIVPFFSMADLRKTLHRTILEHPPKRGEPMLNRHIPYASEIEQMGVKRAAVETYAHSSKAAAAYRALWSELKQRYL